MIRLSDQTGVTLVELLAVVAILSMIIIVISTVQFQFLDSYQEINEGSFQTDETVFFIQFFSKQVREAKEISIQPLIPTAPSQGTKKVIITKSTGAQVEFEFKEGTRSIEYHDNTTVTILVDHVKVDDNNYQFRVTKINQDGKIGVHLTLQTDKMIPIETTVYSLVATSN
ncbi:PilW family protein [Tepidibacillus fermentans]|uniref:Prepilin-type N-terminal cleavage/methylation domain-containing protein n=1 Tax=Tepidibacillus fermentans TaxID=1281767 RepID=A0A4R3K812_9BACI|nr:prepilin-type N-terminal cleavage/methylation domain-containing protein [Tepidibacillus fermentans]TCS79050.1 prepilin-type N-terminal cleavage/methylation domain-containing protein [Tepidibacillus fermentans]